MQKNGGTIRLRIRFIPKVLWTVMEMELVI